MRRLLHQTVTILRCMLLSIEVTACFGAWILLIDLMPTRLMPCNWPAGFRSLRADLQAKVKLFAASWHTGSVGRYLMAAAVSWAWFGRGLTVVISVDKLIVRNPSAARIDEWEALSIDLMAEICALPRGWDFRMPSLDACMYIAALTSDRYTSKNMQANLQKYITACINRMLMSRRPNTKEK